jgi:hypothetical protein
MAWQSSSAISGVSGPGDGNNPTGQPQGTEYTLQGKGCILSASFTSFCAKLADVVIVRGDALSADGMASSRT